MSDLQGKFHLRHLLERYQEKILKYYLKKWPKLYQICFDPTVSAHRKSRMGFSFLLGFVLGILIYAFIIADLQLDKLVGQLTGVTLDLLLSFGCATSLQFRCVCLLTIPGFFGRAGRSALKALVLGYIIAGPIFNLTFNAKEVMRSFTCTTQLTYNLTKTKYDLMLRPFHQAMKNMRDSEDEIKAAIASVNELMEPIVQEIEAEDAPEFTDDYDDEGSTEASGQQEEQQDEEKGSGEIRNETTSSRRKREETANAEYYENKYRHKIAKRCEAQLKRGSDRCRKMFGDAYDRCYETVTWVAGWLLCWPMKITFVCDLVHALGGGNICDPDGQIDVGIGEGYAVLKETRDRLNESLNDASIEFNVDPKKLVMGANDAARVAKSVIRDFEARKRFFNSVITLIKRCLSLIFVKILIDASTYHRKYLQDIEFDNIYVTPYFRKIDARRRARGSLTLLPLKKLEKTKLIDPYSLRQSKQEKRNLFGQSAKLILEVITASTFIFLDRLLFEVLDVVKRHARMDITQQGHHDMSVEVAGRGVVATLIRSLIRGFNVKRRIKNFVTNEACLPRASLLPRHILVKIYGTYFAIWLMIIVQAYSQRSRRLIAAFFYRKREKRRVLYLYNETLRRRLGFLKFARARVAELSRARHLAPQFQLISFVDLRAKFPNKYLDRLLDRFEFARAKCIVCGEIEPRKSDDNNRHVRCRNADCFAIYCQDCWRDVGQRCLACEYSIDEESSPGEETNVDDDDEQEDEDE